MAGDPRRPRAAAQAPRQRSLPRAGGGSDPAARPARKPEAGRTPADPARAIAASDLIDPSRQEPYLQKLRRQYLPREPDEATLKALAQTLRRMMHEDRH